ncbi:MAG: prepilin-type N-terminal cleavage/methylation domain-containing protein [Candidatus Schekmanbacteria bacterium]|nr:prepilin-type N-terminal cleavage/methylation domain-containing protein [Candidatus Schekmanbacteria bacterium]
MTPVAGIAALPPVAPHPTAPARSAGFTLVELLLAIFIGSLVLTAAFALFWSVTAVTANLTPRLARNQDVLTVMNHLEDRLEGLFLSSYRSRALVGSGATGGSEPLLAGTSWSGRPGEPPLVAFVLYLDSQTGSLREEVAIARDGEANPAEPDEPWNVPSHELLAGVEQVAIAYFDGTGWLPSWDADLAGALPEAIRVSIRVARGDGHADEAERTFRVLAPNPRGARR